jgi:hypothetical protein
VLIAVQGEASLNEASNLRFDSHTLSSVVIMDMRKKHKADENLPLYFLRIQ